MLRSRVHNVKDKKDEDEVLTALPMSSHFESGHNNRASHNKPLSTGTCAFFLVSLLVVAAKVSSMVTKKRLARQLSTSSEIALLDPSNPKSEFYQAYQQSFGFLNDIPNKSWKLMKERGQ